MPPLPNEAERNAVKIPPLPLLLALAACQSPLPQNFAVQSLQLVVYRDGAGRPQIPKPLNAGEKRRAGWQNWLAAHRGQWQRGAGQSAAGATLWCAQWQDGKGEQRICNRDNQALVWFGTGVLRDPQAIAEANKIWIGRGQSVSPF
jgi:hypothetical protein